MNKFSKLLTAGAREVLEYRRSSPDAARYGVDWLEGLAEAMAAASVIEDEAELETAIHGIAHAIVDSGPLTADFAPSFDKALDAVQRTEKRRKGR